MSAETWNGLAIFFFAIASVSAVVFLTLFVRFDVWHLYKQLSGKLAQERLKRMRDENVHSTKRRYSFARKTSELAKTTPISNEIKTEETEVLDENRNTGKLNESEETTLLSDGFEDTFVLVSSQKVTSAKNIIDI